MSTTRGNVQHSVLIYLAYTSSFCLLVESIALYYAISINLQVPNTKFASDLDNIPEELWEMHHGYFLFVCC